VSRSTQSATPSIAVVHGFWLHKDHRDLRDTSCRPATHKCK
jgi:hypothetical protein